MFFFTSTKLGCTSEECGLETWLPLLADFRVVWWAFQLCMLLSLLISAVAFVLAPVIAAVVWPKDNLKSLIQLSLLVGIFGVVAHVPIIYFQWIRMFRMNNIVLVAQAVLLFVGMVHNRTIARLASRPYCSCEHFYARAWSCAFLNYNTEGGPRRIWQTASRRFRLSEVLFGPPKTASYETEALESSGISSFAALTVLFSILVTQPYLWDCALNANRIFQLFDF